MPDKYYYLVASLPHLAFAKTSPITREEFLFECRKWMSYLEFKNLAAIDINDLKVRPTDNSVVKEWKSFDLALREELAHIRRAKKESLHEKMPPFFADVFAETSPLVMEKKLQEKRWLFLEEEEFGHHFDVEKLILYFLKLQILERLAAFDKEKGKGVFESLCGTKTSEVAGG